MGKGSEMGKWRGELKKEERERRVGYRERLYLRRSEERGREGVSYRGREV